MVERSESMARKLRERLSLLAMLRRPRVTLDGATLCGVRYAYARLREEER